MSRSTIVPLPRDEENDNRFRLCDAGPRQCQGRSRTVIAGGVTSPNGNGGIVLEQPWAGWLASVGHGEVPHEGYVWGAVPDALAVCLSSAYVISRGSPLPDRSCNERLS